VPDVQAKKKLFYGWIIVLVGFVVMFATGPVFYAFGIYLTSMVKDLGTSRGEAAIAVTIMMLIGVVVNPLAGNAIRELGAKQLMLAGLAVFVLGLALALDAQRHLRDDLRLLVMSATLDGASVARLLGNGATHVRSAGRAFDVVTHYAAN